MRFGRCFCFTASGAQDMPLARSSACVMHEDSSQKCPASRSCSHDFFLSRRRHMRCGRDWSSDVCSSDLFALGIRSMLIQGSIMAYLYAQVPGTGRSIGHAVFFAWLVGGILVSYEALAEAGKYNVPAVGSWIDRKGVV